VTKTTPNETIRRASEALDLAAAGAKQSATDRWYVHTAAGGYPQRILDNAVLVAEGYEGPTHPAVIAPFIASMDPKIAFGVAKLLEAVADADVADGYVEFVGDSHAGPPRLEFRTVKASEGRNDG
jgi:hypothetical protein